MPALTPEAAKGMQLVFIGRGESARDLGAMALAPDVSFILVTESDAAAVQEEGVSGFAGTLLSPIDLRSAELIIHNAAAAFISGKTH